MGQFNCELKVTGLPSEVKAGQMISLTAEVVSADQEIKGVYLSAPMGNLFEGFKKVGDKYELKASVPYGGGGQVYSVNVYATNMENVRNNSLVFNVRAY